MAGDPPNPFVRDGVDVRLVARRQRLILWCVLGALLSTFAPFAAAPLLAGVANPAILGALLTLLILAVRLMVIIGAVLLMRAPRTHVVILVLCALLMIVPLLNLIVLLVVNGRATKLLRKYGLRVGLMGVKDDVVVRRVAANLCRECSYDLTGNVSGRCPECGTPLPLASAARAAGISGPAQGL